MELFFDELVSWSAYHMPALTWNSILEIITISFLIYKILLWVKNSRAWTLLKGIVLILLFTVGVELLEMDTIFWIIRKCAPTAIIALVIVFQPELRRALEQLGSKNIVANILTFEDNSSPQAGQFTDKTITELVKASFEMGKVKTGALMVIERETSLKEIERTGIAINGILSSQLLINIFEHNTPLHDGAVVIRGNQIAAATCYLPLSDNMMISKDLGTRHRAAVGISESSDSMTIIVSEETGNVSLATDGHLLRNMTPDTLREELESLRQTDEEPKRFKILKGRLKNERKAD